MNNQQFPRSIAEQDIETLLQQDRPYPSSELRHQVAQATWLKEHESMPKNFTFRRWVKLAWRPALALMLIGLLSVWTLSGTAQATFNALAREIANIAFHEQTDYPGPDTLDEVTTVPVTRLPIEELANHFPTPLAIPTWAPDGFMLRPMAQLNEFGPGELRAHIEWWYTDKTNRHSINLAIASPPPTSIIIAPESTTEILVNGKPTALTKGVWNADTREWDATASTKQLSWITDDEVQYTLTFGGSVSLEDAIAMVATIR